MHCARKYWHSTCQRDPSETHIDLETDGTVTIQCWSVCSVLDGILAIKL